MTTGKRVLWVGLFAVMLVSVAQAQSQEPSIAGKWQASVNTPHGKMAMVFDVALDAKDPKKVGGTLTSAEMGSYPIEGEYGGGRLTFTVTGAPGELKFAGTLKDASTLVGALSGHAGDLAVTATRVTK
jgi:hypothetical protein